MVWLWTALDHLPAMAASKRLAMTSSPTIKWNGVRVTAFSEGAVQFTKPPRLHIGPTGNGLDDLKTSR